METTEEEQKRSLVIEFFKIQVLCKVMEEMALQVSMEAPNGTECDDKAGQLHYLAITIKDIISDNEEDFIEAIDTVNDKAESKGGCHV